MEFGAALEAVAAHAATAAGAAHVRGLRPSGDPDMARSRLDTTDEMVSLVLRHDWAVPTIPELGGALERLSVAGSALDEAQLIAVGRLLAASRQVRSDLRRDPDGLARLHRLAEVLVAEGGLEKRVQESFAASGDLADGASAELRRIRRDLRGARSEIVARLEAYVRKLPSRFQVPDASVTVRAGRYCIPIRREGASHVGGIVHDESSTHQTLFVEPPSAIDAMNRVASLEREEKREVHRVLLELSDELRPHAEALRASYRTLAEADSLNARARYALEHGGKKPRLDAPGDEAPIEILDGVHPLLLAGGEPAVPFSLRLNPDERVLLISGPNAGGKTVTLKAIGLLSALAQSGVIPPVGENTRLPVFGRFFAVIGDEQSISASLSTFSAQVASIGEILDQAASASLVLLDEVGGATDPAEGAALAAVVLLRLADEARLTVATTHLGALKELAAESPAVVNASLQFDAEHLRPSFVLVRDRPGRSYALEIAGRLGLPPELIERARARLSDSERRMEQVLAELEQAEAELSRLTGDARADARELERRAARLEERERDVASRRKRLEREGREAADRYLLEARQDVEAVIEELRAAAGLAAGNQELGEEEATSARRRVEDLLRESREAAPGPDPGTPGPAGADRPGPLAPGDRVTSRSLGVTGEVAEVRPGGVIVEAGGMRFTLPPDDLSPADPRSEPARSRPERPPPPPELEAHPEVDLRGLRVDEVRRPLLAALDAAIVADLGRLVVIHGKGTGALREEVGRLVGDDPRIATVRPGGFDEGGSGVTVLELKTGRPDSG
jgi:DNA mismatch repair protein MutS2